MSLKDWLIYIAGLCFIGLALVGFTAIFDHSEAFAQHKSSPKDRQAWQVGSSSVNRIYDEETNTLCYVIPQAYCQGHCAYSPAISCVHLQN